MAGIWRNAYFLSTNIDETDVRKQAAKSMANVEFPASFNPLRDYDQQSPTYTGTIPIAESPILDKQQSFYAA